MRHHLRHTLRATAAAALTGGLVLLGAGSASAHVTVQPSTTTAGAYTLLTVGVPHGCDGSPTTRVSIQIPELITSVTPSINPGWEVEKVMADLDVPIDDGHGGQRTERVAEIVYTARTPLPDGFRDAFVLSLKLPDAVGEELVFPALQECEEGETAWAQLPPDGDDSAELPYPAPRFEITAATEDDASTETVSDAAAAAPASADSGSTSASATTTDAAPPAATWAALALGAGGLVLGALALLRTRRRQA
ncbi:YcnI family copper-binding membrane protein [Cellulomonas phragmiteti]|uniref:YcnI family copper-binding membrane protein n=1 Tax=Cellulomonas phragmiteti TaxID=478780 RepID=UPI001944F853|nr:YcnI family protein [Cellulomonas phragmiteti]